MPHIVIAVDGTNSYAYRRRWVEQFYEGAVADYKAYWPGPTDLGGATGLDCAGISSGVILWLTRVLSDCGINIRSATAAQVNLTLVGHSRGGHSVIDVCNRLNFPATFMALYDAVDMTVSLGDTLVIRNSLYTVHARRSPHMDSWSWWGNTGTSVSRGTYEERFFETNHGGVGGDVGDETVSVTSDSSCIYVAPPPNPPVVRERCYRGECFDMPVAPRRRVAHEIFPDIHSRCGVQSDEANSWIRSRAVDSGIRFS